MRLSVAAAVILLAISTSFASPQNDEPTPSERNVRDLADLALAAPPELAADVLLKLLEDGRIKDTHWKQEVLQTAWELAPRATYADDVEPAVEPPPTGNLVRLAEALRVGLSTATIQARVIRAMAKLNSKEAREMFSQMMPPAVESPDCSVDRYTSHRSYFNALRAAAETFSDDEAKRGMRFKFLVEGLRSLTSPEDFVISLGLIQSDSRLSNSEFAQLFASWADMLAGARFSDRLFSSQPIEQDMSVPLLYGVKQMDLRGAPVVPALRAFRAYFVRHTRTARCGESVNNAADEDRIRVAFNGRVSFAAGVLPIEADEIKPVSFGEKAKAAIAARTDKTSEMRVDYSALRSADEHQRGSSEWNDRALQFLDKLEKWSRELNESNRDFFLQKAEWFSGLVYVTPEGRLRQLFLNSYLRFLTGSPVEHESPPEWAMMVNKLINAAEIPDRHAWLDQIEAASDPAVAMYCHLARLKFDSVRNP